MPVLVVDTNVLVSAALHPEGTARKAFRLARRHYDLAFTRETLLELRQVLSRPVFDRLLSRRDRRRFLQLVRDAAAVHRVESSGPLSRDPRDDIFLHLAVAANAVAIVTGDRDLLVLGDFAGIPILSPSRFLRAERSIRRGRRERGVRGERGA